MRVQPGKIPNLLFDTELTETVKQGQKEIVKASSNRCWAMFFYKSTVNTIMVLKIAAPPSAFFRIKPIWIRKNSFLW